MRIQAFMFSCTARDEVREQTLADLARTDWPDEATVVLDQSTAPRKQQRITETVERLLHQALARNDWDFLLLLEDDLAFNRHLRHNLQQWRPLREGAVQLASLYNPNIRPLVELRPFFYVVADPETVYGSQAFLIERGCAEYLARNFHDLKAMPDIRLSRLAARRGPIFYHWPSLVQHVGQESVWGGHFHQAADFDATFRFSGFH